MAGTGEEFGPCPHCGQLHPEDVLLCPTAEKTLPLEGRILDGKFRFTKQLGEGGMGSVWMAENTLVRKTVAIKLMHVQFSRDEGVLARFRNEATAAGRIGSRYICDILDLGKSTLGPYIVMEMLKGSDMADFVQQNHPVDPGTMVMVIRQALIGLQAAHEAGIVHRDLKPENIFLHQPEPHALLVKLMDFGISKFTEGSEAGKTGMGVLMGTPEYMSPEQSEGAAQADARTDIWAIGVIMYWALAGRNPFLGQTLAATLMNVTMRDPPPLAQAAPHAPPGLVEIIHHCIVKDPDHRYQTAAQLSEALAPFEDHTGKMFVPYASKTTGAAMTGPPPAQMTVSAPSGNPAVSTPTPSGNQTFSNEIGNVSGAGPTLGEVEMGFAGDYDDVRPESNMGGGNAIRIVIVLGFLALLSVAGYFLVTQIVGGDPDEKANEVAVAAGEDGGEQTPPQDVKEDDSAGQDEESAGEEQESAGEDEESAGEDEESAGQDEESAGEDEESAGEESAGEESAGEESAGDSGTPASGDPDPKKDDPPPKKDDPPPKKDPPKTRGVDKSKVSVAKRFYNSKATKKNVGFPQAKSFCQKLANEKYGNVSGWDLPANPKRKGVWWSKSGRAVKGGKPALAKRADVFCQARR